MTKLKKEDPQEIKIERIREQKWLKMIYNWDSVSSEKLKKRVYKGIPNSLRGKVWAKLLRVDQLTDDQKNKYKVIIVYLIIIYNTVNCNLFILVTSNYLKSIYFKYLYFHELLLKVDCFFLIQKIKMFQNNI